MYVQSAAISIHLHARWDNKVVLGDQVVDRTSEKFRHNPLPKRLNDAYLLTTLVRGVRRLLTKVIAQWKWISTRSPPIDVLG